MNSLTYSQCIEILTSRLHRSWESQIQLAADQKGFLPYLLPLHCHFKHLNSSEVCVAMQDCELVLDSRVLSVFASVWDASYKMVEFFDAYALAEDSSIGVNLSHLHQTCRSNGQAKIFLGMLQLFRGYSPRYLKVLCIGTSSEGGIANGSTYDLVCLFLTQLGFSGRMSLYDPNEAMTTVYRVGKFEVYVYKEKYDYDDRTHYDVIHEDVWVPDMSIRSEHEIDDTVPSYIPPSANGFFRVRQKKGYTVSFSRADYSDYTGGAYIYDAAHGIITVVPTLGSTPLDKRMIRSLFRDLSVIFSDRDSVVGVITNYQNRVCLRDGEAQKFVISYQNSQIYMLPSGKNHTGVNVSGGGRIRRQGEKYFVYGSSQTYGPYDPLHVAACMGGSLWEEIPHSCGREAYDPHWKLFKNHPNARIMVKWFGEDIKVDGSVVNQLCYSGKEKRFVRNVPPPLPCQVQGDGCQICQYLSEIASSIKTHLKVKKYHLSYDCYSSLVRHPCVPQNGQKINVCITTLLAAARGRRFVHDVLLRSQVSHGITDKQFYRALTLLIRNKMVVAHMERVLDAAHVFVVPGTVDLDGVTHQVKWNACNTRYQMCSTGQIYDLNACPVPHDVVLKAPRLSPKVRTLPTDHAVSRILEKYKVNYRSIAPYGIFKAKGKVNVGVNMLSDVVVLTRHCRGVDMRGYEQKYADGSYQVWFRR